MRIFFTAFAVFFSAIVTGQVRVFVLAGQSNMQGYGKIYDGSNGAIGAIITSFTPSCSDVGTPSCNFTFNMLDGYGDGWNGWTYDFVQNGTVVATETLDNGSEGIATITLEEGILCEVVVNSAGAYAAEISWTLTDPSGDVVASMDGQEDSYPSPNTLLDVVANDTNGDWSMLQTGSEWTVLDNAYLYFENGQGTLIRDKVTIGQGANPELIGPELMFAHALDAYYEEPILIIKAAWGGLSLAEDFRPPSAGGSVGPYYTQMIEMVENVTSNLATEFPELGTSSFEIMGFGWFQGWNDAGSDAFLNEYESNLHHLITDVRTAFGNPELPVVIASAGQGGYEDHWGWMQDVQDIIAVAQENVACDDVLYGGSVGFVNTKPFYMPVLESPDDAGFHYNNNARTFLNVGKSMGEEMVLAINNMAFCEGFVSVPSEDGRTKTLKLYPNPATHSVWVELPFTEGRNTSTRIFDMNGKLMLDEARNGTQFIGLSSFPKGVYVVEIAVDGCLHREKLIVQ